MATNPSRRSSLSRLLALASTMAATTVMTLGLAAVGTAHAADDVLRFGVGLYQPDKEKNDATYRPLAEHLSRQLGRPVKLLMTFFNSMRFAPCCLANFSRLISLFTIDVFATGFS